MLAAVSLPFLTADVPGIGGQIKHLPEDFLVEEVPAYEPCGEGEHLFLWVEKVDVAANDLLRHVARTLGTTPRDIGAAGLKDRRAITRQYLSVPAWCEPNVGRIDGDHVRVLRSARHHNKLRTGHLRGNRFSILVREPGEAALENAGRTLATIDRLGFPNYFGEQRFGREQETLAIGRRLLAGTTQPESISAARRRFLLRMALSAVQSDLFNSVLAERLRDGLLHRVLPGDVMQVTASGGKFVVADEAVEQARFDNRETVLTGPMFGPEMIAPQQEPAEREERVLAESRLLHADFARFPKLTSGTRRPFLVWPSQLRVEQEAGGMRLEFELPSGTYATTLLRELMKGGFPTGEPKA